MTATETQNEALHFVPTLRQHFWRALGFRYHLGEEPEGVEQMVGWMRTDTRMRFGWSDRLRLLLTGRLNVSTIVHMDTPTPMVCKTRLDWMIEEPGRRDR